MVGWPSRTAERVARSTPPAASRAMSNVSRWTAVSGSKKPSPRFRTRSTYHSRWTSRRSAIVAVGGVSTPWKSRSRSKRSTMERRRSGLSTWRGEGTWSRNRGSYTITTMGSAESISRHRPAQDGPQNRDGSMDDTDGQRSLRIGPKSGPRVGNPPDLAGGPPPAPAFGFDGSPAVREMVLGPADHPLPRTELARDPTGGGTMVPGLRAADGRTDLRDRGGGHPYREHRVAQDRPGPPEVGSGNCDRRADVLVERLWDGGNADRAPLCFRAAEPEQGLARRARIQYAGDPNL